MPNVNVIDLFAGAGGLSLGASRAGFNIVAAVELDPHAMATHQINFPNTQHIQNNILSMNGFKLLQAACISKEELCGIIGGPPCQGFSSIGQGDVNDKRNQLFIKFFQLVGELQPVFFVAENVPGILNMKYDQIRTTAFSYVKNYQLLPPISINASEYGAPTTRTRIFFIGYRPHTGLAAITTNDIENKKIPVTQRTTVQQALEGIPNIHYAKNHSGQKKLLNEYYTKNSIHLQSHFFYEHVVGILPRNVGNKNYIQTYVNKHLVNGCLPTRHSPDVRKRYAKLKFGQRDNISKSIKLDPNSFCPTLRAGTGPEKGSYQAVRPIHFKYSRVITPREAARLQGFPDWFVLPETIWHSFRQIGNSVSPIVAEQILSVVYQKLI